MDRTQKIVVALLIVAIIFSVLAIISAVNLSSIDYKKADLQPTVQGPTSGSGAGGVGLVVTGNPEGVGR